MKSLFYVALLSATVSLQATAGNCTGTGTPITSGALDNRMVCGQSSSNTDTWQEFHRTTGGSNSGAIDEFAKGPSDPVDPSQTGIATWSLSIGAGVSTITYVYSPTNTFSFDVYATGANAITFCETGTSVTPVATATLQAGGPCL